LFGRSAEGCFDNQAFYDTVEESADKLWLHTNELAGKVRAKTTFIFTFTISHSGMDWRERIDGEETCRSVKGTTFIFVFVCQVLQKGESKYMFAVLGSVALTRKS
jgi:hypothetical protein